MNTHILHEFIQINDNLEESQKDCKPTSDS